MSAGNGDIPVILNVYDLGVSANVQQLNNFTYEIGGGLFHTAVEVYGKEYSFGYCESGTGVFSCLPRQCELHQFKSSVQLGKTDLSKESITSMIKVLAVEFQGNSYHLLNRNCQTFCQEFARRLDVDEIPSWITRFPAIGLTTVNFVKGVCDQARAVDQQYDITNKATEVGGKVISGVGVALNTAGVWGMNVVEKTAEFEAKHDLRNKAVTVTSTGIGIIGSAILRVGSASSLFRKQTNAETGTANNQDSASKVQQIDPNAQ